MADSSQNREELPLSALLSQALVAFTIEFDNEFEHRMPHRTTNHGSTPGGAHAPWLVSMAMWVHCMRNLPAEGLSAGELARRGQLSAKAAATLFTRMSAWWGYLTISPDPADPRAKPPSSALLVRPTRAGRQAQQIWEPLAAMVEDRWRDRFGRDRLERLRAALAAIVDQLEVQLPDYLPIGEQSRLWRLDAAVARPTSAGGTRRAHSDPPLFALLSKVLLAFTIDFESRSEVSLALSANVLRVVGHDGVRVRDLPALTGVATMAIDNSLSILGKAGYVTAGTDTSAGRVKLVRLAEKGRQAQDAYERQLGAIAHDWQTRFGARLGSGLLEALGAVVGGGTAQDSPLFEGLKPYPDGWRAQLTAPVTLPHYPMVSHRGGFPDGS